MNFLILIEKAKANYSAHVPDLPGCVATGKTRLAVRRAMRSAIRMHLAGLREDGLEIPRAPEPRRKSFSSAESLLPSRATCPAIGLLAVPPFTAHHVPVTLSAMHILVTAGPTREYIDSVRFITNASSGRMGRAVAGAAMRRGHRVTLLCGPVVGKPPKGCRVVPFMSVEDLAAAMRKHFASADAVVMAAAVGDFRPAKVSTRKLRRADGPISLRLEPTPDVLATAAAGKKKGQIVFAFAVEQGPRGRIVTKARAEMARKHADFVLLNTPAAMGAPDSEACILTSGGVALPWGRRPKAQLARQIVRLLEQARAERAAT